MLHVMYMTNRILLFECLECHRKYYSAASAERATMDGCSGCGGVDVDVYVGSDVQ